VRDLTAIGRMLLARGGSFLTAASIDTLVAPAWRFDGANGDTDGGFLCTYGLAVQSLASAGPGCNDDLFGGGRAMIGHDGDAYGLRSGLWVDPARGVGIAFFATGNGDDPPRGRHSAFRAIEEQLASHLGRSGP
jgi:Beta-lactamase